MVMVGPTPGEIRELMEPCEPYGSREIASWFEDVSLTTIRRRLEELHDAGKVRRKKIPDLDGEIQDNSPTLWYVPEKNRAQDS